VVPACCRQRAPRRPAGRLFRAAAATVRFTGCSRGHCWSAKSTANVARLLTCGKLDEAQGLPDGVVEGSLGSGSGWQRLRLVLGTGGLRDLGGRREHGACALYESSALVRPYVPLLLGGSSTQGIV
jgi:hypothetical protein